MKRNKWGQLPIPEEFKGDGLSGTRFETAEEYIGFKLTYDPYGYLMPQILVSIIVACGIIIWSYF